MAVVGTQFNKKLEQYMKQGMSYDEAFAKARKETTVSKLGTRPKKRPGWWDRLVYGIKKELGRKGKKKFSPSRKFS